MRDHVGRARPGAAHAHVERTVEAEREAAGGFVELHRRQPDIEHDAVDRVIAAGPRHAFEIGETVLDQDQPAFGARHQVEARGNRALVAINADDVAVCGGEDRARIAAGAEGRVDIDAAVADVEEFDRGAAEHRNVTDQSAIGSRLPAAAARHHSRAPCGPSAATRVPSCFLSARTFSVASASSARNRAGSQI